MMTVFIFGNPLVKNDSLPLQLLPKLKKLFPEIIFIHADPNEDIVPPKDGPWLIIDTMVGVKKMKSPRATARSFLREGRLGSGAKSRTVSLSGTGAGVTVFTDIDSFLTRRRVSPHDYDLAFHLKLLKKAKKLTKVTILGIPPTLTEKEAYRQLRLALSAIVKAGN